jgi:hypothetical protein
MAATDRVPSKRHEAAQQQRAGQQVGQHHRVPQPQALRQGHREQPDQRRGAGGQQDRQEHQRRVARALLRAVHEDGDRKQGQRRSVEHQEQDLRVGGRHRVGVEPLQLAHGLQADGRGGVVQPQRVGREVHGDEPERRVPGGHARHQAPEERPQQPREPADQPRRLGDAQETEPQRERAEQQHHHLDRQPRHGEQALDQRREHRPGRPRRATAPAPRAPPSRRNQATSR